MKLNSIHGRDLTECHFGLNIPCIVNDLSKSREKVKESVIFLYMWIHYLYAAVKIINKIVGLNEHFWKAILEMPEYIQRRICKLEENEMTLWR